MSINTITNTAWKVQSMLHNSNSFALPGSLLLSAMSLVLYKHVTDEREGFDNLKTFLVLIVIQMVPLIVLEMKILACLDPVQLLSRFGPKVLLMHASFLALRVVGHTFYEHGDWYWNVAWLVAACAALRKGFGLRLSLATLREHCDVWCLVLLALSTAAGTKYLDSQFHVARTQTLLQFTVATGSDYIEILAFTPAVWRVLQAHTHVASQRDISDPRTRVLFFFAFLVSFYFTEDILSAIELARDIPLAAAGHLAHFLLLLDFAGFLLAHIYNPEKLKGELLRWLPGSDSYDV